MRRYFANLFAYFLLLAQVIITATGFVQAFAPQHRDVRKGHLFPLGSRGHGKPTDEYDTESEVVVTGGGYIPGMGMESIVHTLGETRPLLDNELEVALTAYKGLLQACLAGTWPPNHPRAQVVARRVWERQQAGPLSETDIERRMEIFRKVILGVEKYRISNPSNIAQKYVDFLSACLSTPEAWGCAAYSLEYAGLVIRDHVRDTLHRTQGKEGEGKGGGDAPTTVPVINLSSLWRQCAVRLLDLEFAAGANVAEVPSDRAARLGTSDQRYFSQADLGAEGERAVRDMMLGAMRVVVRTVLSRPEVRLCRVQMAEGGGGLDPPFSAVRLLLGLDFRLEADGEAMFAAPAEAEEGEEGEEGEEEEDVMSFLVSARGSVL